MTKHQSFHALLRSHVKARGYTAGKLAPMTGLPKTSIENWLKTTQKRLPLPRRWTDIAKMACAMGLDANTTDELLQAAGHGRLQERFLSVHSDEDRALLSTWKLSDGVAPEQLIHKPSLRKPLLNRVYEKFFGREQHMTQLQSFITDPAVRLVVITGMSGIGKSSLVTEFAIRFSDAADYEVCSMNLRELGHFSIEAVATNLLTQLIGPFHDQLSALAVLEDLLKRKDIVVILDNLNSLTGDQLQKLLSYLKRVLPEGGKCKAILITQTPIREMSNWSFARHLKIDSGLSSDEALQLIRHHCQDLSVDDAEIALKVIPLIDGNPKLLEAIIGKAKRWGWIRAFEEAQGMTGEIGESATQLIQSLLRGCSKEANILLERSIVIPTGAFMVEEIHALAGSNIDVRWELEQLVEASLASYQKETGLFRIHQLVHEVINKRTNGAGQTLDRASSKLGCYYVSLLQSLGPFVAPQQTVLQNVIAVAQRWATPADPVWEEIYCLLGHHFYYRRDFVSTVTMFNELLLLTEDHVSKERATALHFLAILQSGPHTGHFHNRDAVALYEECIQLHQVLDAKLSLAYVLCDLGYELFHRGMVEQAKTYIEDAVAKGQLQVRVSLNDHQIWGIILRTTGHFFRQSGHFQRAAECYRASQESLEISQNFVELIDTITSYAALLLDKGEHAQAITVLYVTIARATTHDRKSDLTYTWSVLGKALTLQGDLDNAAVAYEASIQCADDFPLIEKTSVQFIAAYGLGRIALRKGHFLAAITHLQESIRLRRSIGQEQGVPDVLLLLVQSFAQLGQRDTATQYLDDAIMMIGKPSNSKTAATLEQACKLRESLKD